MSREIFCDDVTFDNGEIYCADVTLGQTVVVKEGPEKYTPAPITPTESRQEIPTKDKQLTDDVVVEPIPSEYVIPSGTMEITVTENGTIVENVAVYAAAQIVTNVVGLFSQTKSVDVIGNDTQYLSFDCPFEPDIVIIYAINQTDENLTASALAYAAGYNKFGIGCRYTGSGFYAGYAANISSELPWGVANGNTQVEGRYSNGVFTVRYRGPNASYWWNSNYTYRCIGFKY